MMARQAKVPMITNAAMTERTTASGRFSGLFPHTFSESEAQGARIAIPVGCAGASAAVHADRWIRRRTMPWACPWSDTRHHLLRGGRRQPSEGCQCLPCPPTLIR